LIAILTKANLFVLRVPSAELGAIIDLFLTLVVGTLIISDITT